MSVNLFKIKKWTKMVMGNSSYHVLQDEGKCYSKDKISGYYNNLTEKITRFGMPGEEIPITADEDGSKRHFAIAIFQYGLAAYDLYLMTKDKSMLRRMKNCVEWAIDNQLENGAWKTFEPQNPKQPFSSMAQGEGISLLTRYAIVDKDNKEKYIKAAERAFQFLITPRTDGGVAERNGNQLFLYEFTYLPLVLNGWIFSVWGILDYYKATGCNYALKAWEESVDSITEKLHEFDGKYWSKYNLGKNLSSPFYHRLHIAQLNVMYELTGKTEFRDYAERWSEYSNRKSNRIRAFVKKAIQKIIE